MIYAIWYDNSSGRLEPFKVVEAQDPEEAIGKARAGGLGWSVDIVLTEATESDNGFGNDPNIEQRTVLAKASAAQ